MSAVPVDRVALATRSELVEVAAVLSRAFADDPVQQWLFAPADQPSDGIADLMVFFLERYFRLGHVYVGGGLRGATLWAPPDRHALSEPDMGPLFEMVGAHVGPDEAVVRLGELARAYELLPPEPHVYLGVAGVDPDAQGGGLGTTLLAPGLTLADAGGFAVHLESSNPRNLGFYHRHGFEAIAELRLGGDDGPLLTPMRREPR